MLALGVGYLACMLLPAFPSYLTEYPWDVLKLQRCLIPGPRAGDLSRAGSAGTPGWAPADVSGAELPAPWHSLWKHPEPWSTCGFSLPSGKICMLPPPSATSSPKPSLLSLAFFSYEHVDEQLTDFRFILSQLHIHRWQYSSIFKKKEIGGGHFLKIWH